MSVRIVILSVLASVAVTALAGPIDVEFSFSGPRARGSDRQRGVSDILTGLVSELIPRGLAKPPLYNSDRGLAQILRRTSQDIPSAKPGLVSGRDIGGVLGTVSKAISAGIPGDKPGDIPSGVLTDALGSISDAVPSGDEPSAVPSGVLTNVLSSISDIPADVAGDKPSLIPSAVITDVLGSISDAIPAGISSDKPAGVNSILGSLSGVMPSDKPGSLVPAGLLTGVLNGVSGWSSHVMPDSRLFYYWEPLLVGTLNRMVEQGIINNYQAKFIAAAYMKLFQSYLSYNKYPSWFGM